MAEYRAAHCMRGAWANNNILPALQCDQPPHGGLRFQKKVGGKKIRYGFGNGNVPYIADIPNVKIPSDESKKECSILENYLKK